MDKEPENSQPNGMFQYVIYYLVAFLGIPILVGLSNVVFNMNK